MRKIATFFTILLEMTGYNVDASQGVSASTESLRTPNHRSSIYSWYCLVYLHSISGCFLALIFFTFLALIPDMNSRSSSLLLSR